MKYLYTYDLVHKKSRHLSPSPPLVLFRLLHPSHLLSIEDVKSPFVINSLRIMKRLSLVRLGHPYSRWLAGRCGGQRWVMAPFQVDGFQAFVYNSPEL